MKKLIATLASLALLAGSCAMPAAAEETYSLGDVTMDGMVDIRDVQELMGYYNHAVIMSTEHIWLSDQYAAADVNADGTVNHLDVTCLLGYCTKRIVTKGSQNPDIYFAKAAVGVENYSLGDVNMDGVVDYVDCAEVQYAVMAYCIGQNVTESHWTEGQLVLANVTNQYDNARDEGVMKGSFNAYDSFVLEHYIEYTVIIGGGIEPEEFFQDPFSYFTVEMRETALQSAETRAALDQYRDAYRTFFRELQHTYNQQRSEQ